MPGPKGKDAYVKKVEVPWRAHGGALGPMTLPPSCVPGPQGRFTSFRRRFYSYFSSETLQAPYLELTSVFESQRVRLTSWFHTFYIPNDLPKRERSARPSLDDITCNTATTGSFPVTKDHSKVCSEPTERVSVSEVPAHLLALLHKAICRERLLAGQLNKGTWAVIVGGTQRLFDCKSSVSPSQQSPGVEEAYNTFSRIVVSQRLNCMSAKLR